MRFEPNVSPFSVILFNKQKLERKQLLVKLIKLTGSMHFISEQEQEEKRSIKEKKTHLKNCSDS